MRSSLRPFLVLRPFCCLETWNEKQFCWTYESWLTYISSKLLLKLKAKRVHLFPFVILFIHSWRKSTGNFNSIPGNLFSTLPQATMLSYFSPLKRIYILFTPVSNSKFFTCLQGVSFTKTLWGSSSSYLHLSPKDNVTYLSEVLFFVLGVVVVLMTTHHCKYPLMIWSFILLLITINLSGIKQKQAYYDHNYLDMGFN